MEIGKNILKFFICKNLSSLFQLTRGPCDMKNKNANKNGAKIV